MTIRFSKIYNDRRKKSKEVEVNTHHSSSKFEFSLIEKNKWVFNHTKHQLSFGEAILICIVSGRQQKTFGHVDHRHPFERRFTFVSFSGHPNRPFPHLSEINMLYGQCTFVRYSSVFNLPLSCQLRSCSSNKNKNLKIQTVFLSQS